MNRTLPAATICETGGDPASTACRRVQQPAVTAHAYDIPEDFHPLRFLSSARGSVAGEPAWVELFFSPAVWERVAGEDFGALTEPPVTLGSGHARVILHAGNWLEPIPWMLRWGDDVEVITPPELRAQVAGAFQQGEPLSPASGGVPVRAAKLLRRVAGDL